MSINSKLAAILVIVLAFAMPPKADAQLLRSRTSQCACQPQMVRYCPTPQYNYTYPQATYVQPNIVAQPTLIGQPNFISAQPMVAQPPVNSLIQPTWNSVEPALPSNAITFGGPVTYAETVLNPTISSVQGTPTLAVQAGEGTPILGSASDIPIEAVEITETSQALPNAAPQPAPTTEPVASPEPVPTGDTKIMTPPATSSDSAKSVLKGT